MNPKRVAWRFTQVVLAVVLLSLLLGQILGQPLLLTYVTTGRLEPTLSPGDGFVALPTELTGSPGEGDIVVFNAEEIQGGGLTTHRVVGETERGLQTRGDANPFTDQDGGEPPVREAEVLAVAWQPGGDVFVVPRLGDVVTGIQSLLESLQLTLARLLGTNTLLGLQGLAYLILAGSLLFYVVDWWLADPERSSRTMSRSAKRGTSHRRIVLGLTLVVCLGLTVSMVVPAGTDTFDVLSAEFESDSPDVIEQGTSETFDYEVVNGGVFPTVVTFEEGRDNIDIEDTELTLPRQSTAEPNLTLTAPPETGNYQFVLEEHRYLGLLPPSVLLSLHDIHPWLPILALDLFVGVPFYLFGIRFIGTGRTVPETRETPSLLARLRAKLF